MDRRALLVLMLAAPLNAAPRLPRPGADFKASAINWPLDGGRLAHGYMAVPEHAHGPQPAVLLIGDTAADELDDRVLVRALAQAGFIACALNRATAPDDATLRDTLRWLAGNAYATGRVAVLGIGGGGAVAARLLDERAATIGAAIDPTARAAWTRAADARSVLPRSLDWSAAWAMVTAFFREQLT